MNILATLYAGNEAFFEETPDGKRSGFFTELLDRVAVKAGFTYTIVSVPLTTFRPELDWTAFSSIALERWTCIAPLF